MAKFNKAATATKTVNLAGGKAYSETSKLELASILLTSFAQDQYYRSAGDTMERLTELVQPEKMHKFAAKAAIYARTKFGMRSITHALAGELAKVAKGQTWTKDFYNKVIYRPDDATEIVSYYLNKYGKPLPNSLKKGLRTALSRFSAYQIAKYRGEGKAVKMVDLVNLTHPQGSEALQGLVNGTLKSTETWETKLTQAGQTAENEEEKLELKGKAWKELLTEKNLGYFALLRNLRNITEQAPEMLDLALEQLVDDQAIQKSLVMPFRFITALEELSKGRLKQKVIYALNAALEKSLVNVPKFEGKTCVVVDCSGSMEGRPAQIASLFAAVLVKTNECDLMLFSDDAKYLSVNARDSLGSLSKQITFASGGTNFPAIFQRASVKYDRMVILSDMQGWQEGGAPSIDVERYKKKYDANPKIFSFDLAGHGTLQFPQNNVYCLAGFSEKVFEVMRLLEKDRNALVTEIDGYDLQ